MMALRRAVLVLLGGALVLQGGFSWYLFGWTVWARATQSVIVKPGPYSWALTAMSLVVLPAGLYLLVRAVRST